MGALVGPCWANPMKAAIEFLPKADVVVKAEVLQEWGRFIEENQEVDIEDDSAMTEQDTDRTFVAESIEQAMRKLSPGARAVFVLHDIEGYTHGEIGEELGITSGGSKSQLFKARAKLKKLLAHLVDESSTVAVKGKAHVAPV